MPPRTKIPVTRPLTIMIHEQAYEAIKIASQRVGQGSMSHFVRSILYYKLYEVGIFSNEFLGMLDGTYNPNQPDNSETKQSTEVSAAS